MHSIRREVRNRPPSELSTIPSESSWVSSWREETGGEDVEYEEEVEDEYEYEDSFEEYISEEEEKDEEERQPVEWTAIDLQNGVKLLVPEVVSEFKCQAVPLSAERRTEILMQFPHYHDETMVSDVYRLEGQEIKSLNCNPKFLQIPLVLPTTRLDVNVLFRFHVMVYGDGVWTSVPAQYEDNLLKFRVKCGEYFVAYARPIPEFKRISGNAFTFVSNKDKCIKVHIPKGAVDTEMTIAVKVQPVDTDRLKWYRAYDPTAFEGIYALSDILSVRHKMENVFRIDTSVQLPIADFSEEDYELKGISIENNNYVIRDIEKESSFKGVAVMPHTVNNDTSCQVACVRQGVASSALREAALFQARKMDMCTVLMYISKENRDRWLTVELVESPSANQAAEARQQRNYFEIIGSRSGNVPVHLMDRIRVHLSGNMRSAEQIKKTKYTFEYKNQLRNNCIQFRTQKVSTGTTYSVVEVSIGAQRVLEVHFNYPDKGYKLKEMNILWRHGATTEQTQYPPTRTPPAQEPPPIPDSETASSSGSTNDTGYNTEGSERHSDASSRMRRSESLNASSDDSGACPATNEGESGSTTSRLSRSVSRNRPTSAWAEETVVSSAPEYEHPVLTQRSLLVLARNVPLSVCQEALITLGMNLDTINKIKQDAKDDDVNEVFLILLRWYQRMKTTKDSVDLIKDLEAAFKSAGRTDLSTRIENVRDEERGFTNEDFA
ncbi:uncharacterized protein LOC124138711 [Haliotis rufescens]|uniref:uncharacterized protein LOC124138711 n=1 Tax=Haliotis rufescens TaxID=6454 RepID=UPI00201EC791|nr:uncharacterized protein LOC124138711 [Haliotis rufescens]